MKFIGVTYQRKSTDRDDIQQNSLDVQIDHNNETKSRHSVDIIKDIIESVSAKDSGKRSGFNEMIQMAREGKINCIIVDEPTRLSRNTVDTAAIVDLMEKGNINTIFSYGTIFRSEMFMEVEMLERYLGFGKLDNKQRSKSTTEKMLGMKKNGILLGKAPFGYRNILIKKGHKDVEIVEEEKDIGMQILKKVVSGQNLADIGREMYNLGLQSSGGKPWNTERVKQFVTHHFYRGFAKFQGELYEHKYPLIFPQELIDMAQEKIGRRSYTPKIHNTNTFPLKGILKYGDNKSSGEPFVAYEKKGNVYYKTNAHKINISQDKIVESFWKVAHKFQIPKKLVPSMLEGINKYYKEVMKDNTKNENQLKREITQSRDKKKKLFDLYYKGNLTDEEFIEEKNELKEREMEMRKNLDEMISVDDTALEHATFFIELFSNLKAMGRKLDSSGKIDIIKMVCIELRLNEKKELKVQPTQLFYQIMSLNSIMVSSAGIEPTSTP